MPTINNKKLVYELIAADGYYENDPRVLAIHSYPTYNTTGYHIAYSQSEADSLIRVHPEAKLLWCTPEFQFKRSCRSCRTVHTLPITLAQYVDWQSGTLIQKAMPDLPADLRELFISGTCGICFDKLFKDLKD